MREKLYGLAVSYTVSAEDWPGLGHVVDRVLDEYVVHGVPLAWRTLPKLTHHSSGPDIFTQHASQIAPSLQDIQSSSLTTGVFGHRLQFVVRYAQFHQLRKEQQHQDAAWQLVQMLHDGIVPRAWRAVVLVDAMEYLQGSFCFLGLRSDDGIQTMFPGPSLFFSSQGASELLQKLEEIFLFTDSPQASVEHLDILSKAKGGEKDARLCLKALRLSLARYFALVYQNPSI